MPYKNKEDRVIRQKKIRDFNRQKSLRQLGNKCSLCLSTESLQFDHITPSTKKNMVSSLFSSSAKTLQEEIKKCQLLCQSCHTKKTMKEMGRISSFDQHGTLSAYVHAKCRCIPCKNFWNKKTKEYKKK